MNFIYMLLHPPVEAMRIWNLPRTGAVDGDHMRTCIRCNKEKPSSDFLKNHRKCKACMLEIQRKQQAKRKGK